MSTKYHYQGIEIDRKNPDFVNDFSKTLLDGYYVRKDESIPQALARPAVAFCFGDYALAQRIYDYAYKGWFAYASPVLSNAPKGRWVEDSEKKGAHYWYNHTFFPEEKMHGMPISCFAFTAEDTIKDQIEVMAELASLSISGGGCGAHNRVRAPGGKSPGALAFEKCIEGLIGYYRQGTARRGAIAYYMDVDHPEILEHIFFRVPGGDTRRKSTNNQQFHSAVNLTDEFIEAVLKDLPFELKCPHTGVVSETVKARDLWEKILDTRALTGEPYMLKIDLANRMLPESQKRAGLRINGSNLCAEVLLPTGETRSLVCCLSSLNLEKYDDWKDSNIVQDLVRFLDNVLQFFISNAPAALGKAKFSAEKERAIGLGTLGWHSYLQKNNIPFESGGFNSAVQLSNTIFSLIKSRAVEESKKLAQERGEPDDMIGTGLRNSHLMALAPNAASSDIVGASPSIEPIYRNIYVKETRAGSFAIKNKNLEALLESKGMNTKAVWKAILDDRGSVQNLDGLTDLEKKVYKTAMEIDQHWLIELANQRGKYICQAQSLNLFFPPGSDRAYVNSVHLKFLKSEFVKTLYYYRTEKANRVDTAKEVQRQALKDWNEPATGEECIACQG